MNKNIVFALLIGVLNLFALRSADATVEVTYFNTVGTQLNTVPFANNAPVSVSLNANIGSVRVVVTPTPSQGDIGRITVTGTAGAAVTLFVTNDLNPGSFPPASIGARDLDGVTDTTGLIRFKGNISGDLTGDVAVASLVYLVVADEIQQPIRSSSVDFRVEAGRVGVAGDMTMDQDEIALVRITTGDLLGDVKALDGSITSIDVQAGDIGSSTNPVTIEASAVALSGFHIQSIHADGYMYANIDCNTSTTADDGVMQVFHVGDINNSSTTGDFDGSIKLGHFTNHMTMMRDCYATIEHGDALGAGSATVPLRILIGRSLMTGAQINLPSLGLNGFVMIARLPDSGTGDWNGTVSVGTNALNAYNYSTLASSLGRGAAGLTPYRLHNQSCMPQNGATAIIAGSSLSSVRLRHYGPLTWNSASGVPANVWRRLACTTGSYSSVTVTTSNFALADDNPSAVEAPCNLVVTLPFEVGYEYKIERATNPATLFCFGNDSIAVQWDAPYVFTVRSECYADMNQSGQVNIDDLLLVINYWGSCPSSPSPCPADVEPSPCGGGTVDIDDLLAVVNSWGMDCPTGDIEDVGSLSSVQDCMDAATNEAGLEPFSEEWDGFVAKCVDGLCQAQIIVCD